MLAKKVGFDFKEGQFWLYKPDTEFIILCNQICSIVVTLGLLVLFICHVSRLMYFYRLIKRQQNSDGISDINVNMFPLKVNKHKLGVKYYYIYINHVLTVLSLIFGLINSIGYPLLYYVFDILLFNCDISLKILALSWFFGRVCMYYICIFRMFIAFWGSHIDYSKKFKVILLSFLIIQQIYYVIAVFLTTHGYNMETNNIKWCQYGYHLLPGAISVISELLMNVVLLVLFIKPLIILSKNSDNIPSGIRIQYINTKLVYKNKANVYGTHVQIYI